MLTTSEPPEAEKRTIQRYSREGTRGLAGVAAGAVLTISCRKYTLPLKWKGRTITFMKPRFVGWQHLVTGSSEPVRISTRTHGRKHSIACVSAGPFATAAEAAIKELEADRRLSRRRYTVSSLSVSALMVQALWLRAKSGDRFWILEPSHGATVRGRLLTRRQLETSLRRVFGSLAADVPTVEQRLSESADED
jgi:hypothetical protein